MEFLARLCFKERESTDLRKQSSYRWSCPEQPTSGSAKWVRRTTTSALEHCEQNLSGILPRGGRWVFQKWSKSRSNWAKMGSTLSESRFP